MKSKTAEEICQINSTDESIAFVTTVRQMSYFNHLHLDKKMILTGSE